MSTNNLRHDLVEFGRVTKKCIGKLLKRENISNYRWTKFHQAQPSYLCVTEIFSETNSCLPQPTQSSLIFD